MSGKAHDRAEVSVYVAVPQATAFEVFTQEIDLWWRKGPAYRIAGHARGTLHFELGLGGRILESFDGDAGPHTFEVGTVKIWQPPALLEFEWRGVNFKPGESTPVEVAFTARGEGTLVSVVHRGWSALPSDHPVRHGEADAEFIRSIGLWWGSLMTSLRRHTETR